MKTVLQKNDSRALSATQSCCWNLCCGELFSGRITSNCSCFCLYLFVSSMLTTFIWDLSLKSWREHFCLILMHKKRKVSLEGLLCMESQVFPSLVNMFRCSCACHMSHLFFMPCMRRRKAQIEVCLALERRNSEYLFENSMSPSCLLRSRPEDISCLKHNHINIHLSFMFTCIWFWMCTILSTIKRKCITYYKKYCWCFLYSGKKIL